jgi:hypothetical protein
VQIYKYQTIKAIIINTLTPDFIDEEETLAPRKNICDVAKPTGISLHYERTK